MDGYKLKLLSPEKFWRMAAKNPDGLYYSDGKVYLLPMDFKSRVAYAVAGTEDDNR